MEIINNIIREHILEGRDRSYPIIENLLEVFRCIVQQYTSSVSTGLYIESFEWQYEPKDITCCLT